MKATKPQASHRGHRQWGRAQLHERTDPYELADKPREPAPCPQCSLAYHKGRWQWAAGSTGAKQLCPACRRINDKQPAGMLTVGGAQS